MYRVVLKKGTVLLSTSLAWPAVAGCSQAEAVSQLSSISFAQPCITIWYMYIAELMGHVTTTAHCPACPAEKNQMPKPYCQNTLRTHISIYRAEKKSLQILLSSTQAGPGRKVKQEQGRNFLQPRTKTFSLLCTATPSFALNGTNSQSPNL